MRNGQIAALVASVVLVAACSKESSKPPTSAGGNPASASRSSVALSAGSVPADGVTPATVVVRVRDDAGRPVSGSAVTLGYSGSATAPEAAATDADGEVSFRMTSAQATSGTVTASVAAPAAQGAEAAGAVVVDSAPTLAFHGCAAGTTFRSGACVPPGFLRLPPAVETAWGGGYYGSLAVGDLDGNGLADVVVLEEDRDSTAAFEPLLADGAGGFVYAGRVATGLDRQGGVLVADVTGDTIADVVAVRRSTLGVTEAVLVFPGIGDGRLAAPLVSAALPTSPTLHQAADLDGDGDLDLVLGVNSGSLGPAVMLNDGHGGFGPLTMLGGVVPNFVPISVRAADVNGDGALDLVGAWGYHGGLGVYLGHNDGTFDPALPTSTDPLDGMATGDVDGDGRAEVVTVRSGSAGVLSVRRAGADGTLGAPADVAVAGTSVAVGDLDGDGVADVAVGRTAGVLVLYGTRGGGLELGAAYAADASVMRVAIAALDGAGPPGIIAYDSATSALQTFHGLGGRAFSGETYRGGGSVAAGDADGDGFADVLVAGSTVQLFRGRGDGSFAMPSSVDVRGDASSGRFPFLGDLDGDGQADAIVCTPGANEVAILAGQAGGGLGPPTYHAVGKGPYAAAVGDLDGDGRADLVVADGAWDGGTVSVLLGQSGGTLASAVEYPAAPYPRSLALGDLDGDGHLDAVVGGGGSGGNAWELRVLRGDGAGGFAAPVAYSAGAYPSVGTIEPAVVLADFDGDGHLDAAANDIAGGAVGVFPGNGDGTLGTRVTYPVGGRLRSLAAVDVDGDGHVDLVTEEERPGAGTVSWLRGRGDGTFEVADSWYAGWGAGRAVAADLDGDRYGDVVAASGAFDVYRGGAAGLGGFLVAVGGTPTALQVADVDGDGLADLVTASADQSFASNHSVTVACSEGDGTFRVTHAASVDLDPVRLRVADVNGDERPDVVVTHGSTGRIGVLLGTGGGAFGTEVFSSTWPATPGSLALGDVDGDGKLDLVLGGSVSAYFMRGQGDGRFDAAVAIASGAGSAITREVELADLDGDGHLDLVASYQARFVGQAAGEVAILLGNGDGTFAARMVFPTRVPAATNAGEKPQGIVVADLDGDGHLDVAVSTSDGVLKLLRGDGAGGFAASELWLPASTAGLAAADLDRDGHPDLVSVGADGTLTAPARTLAVHRNDGAAAFASVAFSVPMGVTQVGLGDVDGDLRPDVAILAPDAGVFVLRNTAP